MLRTSELNHRGLQSPSEKISWSSLKRIIERGELASLQRSSKQEEFYRNYINKVKQNWRSINDFILCHKFDYEVIPVSVSPTTESELNEVDGDNILEGQKVECKGDHSLLPPLLSSPSGMQWAAKLPRLINNDVAGKRLVLARNDFPYFFEDDVEHWCLWKLTSEVTIDDIQNAIQDLNKKGCYAETLYWVNPVHLKSLPGIDHAHIVCLRKDSL